MRKMRVKAGIRSKLFAIVALSAVILAAAGLVALNFIHAQLLEDRTTMVKAINDVAVAQAVQLQHQVEANVLTRDQAISALRETLHTARFGEGSKDYTFAYFMDGVALSNAGNTAIEGKNLLGMTAPNGQHVIQDPSRSASCPITRACRRWASSSVPPSISTISTAPSARSRSR
jgi:signal transduction histidine kinase